MTRTEIARHELAHLVAGVVAMKKLGHSLRPYVGEIDIQKSGAGGHCMIYPTEASAEKGIDTPYQVNRLMAMGPATLKHVDHFRGVLRAKKISQTDGISGPDYEMVCRNGSDTLSIADCEVLCATAHVVHSKGFDTAARAVEDCGSLVMPLHDWFPPSALIPAMALAGKTFMALHDRRGELPKWLVDSIERRAEAVAA